MHPPGALAAALTALPAVPLEGVLFRAVDLETLFGFHRPVPYPEPRPLYSLGAPARGARYTPRGGPASLYLAEDPEAAYAAWREGGGVGRRERFQVRSRA